MKTLVLYATKYGAAKEIAERIARQLGETALCGLGKDNIPPLAEFDGVIIGSGLYAGAIRKEAKEFILQNADTLCGKKLGLFICGLEAGNEPEYFKTNFPAEILKAAKAARFLGGVFDPKKSGTLERFAIKVITKQSGRIDKMDDAQINAFVNEFKSGLKQTS